MGGIFTTPTIESYLDSLPDDIEGIDLSKRNLTYIPKSIIRFTNLKGLDCSYNKITELPPLPPTLIELWCGYNKITKLPPLPPTLETLLCGYNNLTRLPHLPPTLKYLHCGNISRYYDLNCNFPYPSSNHFVPIIIKLQRFEEWYCYQKCRDKLMSAMWKARERIARREGHPDRMWEAIVEADGDFEAAAATL
jgi:hypothetical protein